jgi:hypothetical protein
MLDIALRIRLCLTNSEALNRIAQTENHCFLGLNGGPVVYTLLVSEGIRIMLVQLEIGHYLLVRGKSPIQHIY